MLNRLWDLGVKVKGQVEGPRHLVRESWDILQGLPQGKRLYSALLGLYVPYTGSMGAQVEHIGMGEACVALKERRGVRNHLRSIHAIALANLVELAGNLALSYSMPVDARFIVSRMEIDYIKKARGTIRARCRCPIPTSNERQTYIIPVEVFNEAGELLVKATLHSLVGPRH